MAHTVFICHSSKDKLIADAACAALEAQRIPCWIAPRDILAGDEYGESIIDALSGCQIVLLIFSLNANNSPQVRREIERAVSKEKIIVPFRIEDVLPSRAMEFALSNTHWMDAISPPMEHRLTELCATISRLMQRQSGAGPMWQAQPSAEEVERKEREAEEARLKEAEATRQAEALRLREEAERQRQLQVREQEARREAQRKAREAEVLRLKEAAEREAEARPLEDEQRKGGFPKWAWGLLAAVALIAVFAAGRLFAPSPAPMPTPADQPQPEASQTPPATAPVAPTVAATTPMPAASKADPAARDKAAQEARDQQAAAEQQRQQQAAAAEQLRQQQAASAPAAEQQRQQQAAAEAAAEQLRQQQAASQAAAEQQRRQEEASPTWTDPATGLMWTRKDNGSNVTWQQAMDYCQRLQLAGHGDWRLATIDELQGIYDGRFRGSGDYIKGNLDTSAAEWSSSQNASGLAEYLIFFAPGGPIPEFRELGSSEGTRALCVRRSGG